MVLKETWKATDVRSCSEFLGLKVVSTPALQSKQLPGGSSCAGVGKNAVSSRRGQTLGKG